MKNKKIMVLIALVVFLAGCVGSIICIVPSYTSIEQPIVKYVKAINAGDTQKIREMGVEYVLAEVLDYQFDDSFDTDEQPSTDKIYNALAVSEFGIPGDLPEDFKEIKSVKIVGFVEGEQESYMSLVGWEVDVVLEITFVDAEGNTRSICTAEESGVIRYNNKYCIGG